MNPTHQTQSGPVTVDTDAAFLGCLMRCDAATARRLLAGMRPDDMAQPLAREVFALAIRLNLREVAPGPAALYAEARRAGRLDTEHKHALLTDWLIDTYRAAPDPVVGDYLKTAVLEAAYRRALREHATRMLHQAEHIAAEELADLATLDERALDLWQRHQAATTPEQSPTTTPDHSEQAHIGELSDRSGRLSRTDHQPPPATADTAEHATQTTSVATNRHGRRAA
ncbi:hypothetical protein [Haloactinomyces albus]|uniref:Replicative DNA helicase n=1 Tax=Haloactinomyces albus TaxID=1352928 RepID=A0AAE4CJS8_9ACTN|nr:hypothetical protein [Haloactinomyces albus]MDR7300400.1 replicative DNA helicase [Haloactinomyces albus]